MEQVSNKIEDRIDSFRNNLEEYKSTNVCDIVYVNICKPLRVQVVSTFFTVEARKRFELIK